MKRVKVSVVLVVLVLAALLGGAVAQAGGVPSNVFWKAVCPDFATVTTETLPGGETVVYCSLFGSAER